MDNKAMYKLSYGLFVLTARERGMDNGCIINTAIQVTSTPNQLSICVNKGNLTHDMILRTNRYTISVISQAASFELFQHFGFQSGKNVNKFADFKDCCRGKNGIYYITAGTNAYITVEVSMMKNLGSHTMFIGEISDMELLHDEPSATYEYYMNHIKPQAPAVMDRGNVKLKYVWRCRICNYEYEGEELPEDFICPICGHPTSDFERVLVNGG